MLTYEIRLVVIGSSYFYRRAFELNAVQLAASRREFNGLQLNKCKAFLMVDVNLQYPAQQLYYIEIA